MKFAALLLSLAAVMPAQNFFTSPMPSSRVSIANVEETPREVHFRRLWVASIVAMTAGTAADAYSSWHKRESNSFLASADGTFGAKGVSLKAGIAGAVLVPQILLRHHRDWHLPFAASNFVEAGIFAGATAHNLNVK
jgi:hypothetical protein